ncbi:hypothetical protein Zm00014a_028403 [Zea mays]|uniref:Uncharacterized protein n=1 Tax=Zea mays TaxID=4577 RepID=A0A3L6EDQ3_MAIZE|nr:hypothetical protein Zm00014a_028403 [Zea mays]
MRVPGCRRRGEAHRGNGHGGAPTAAGNRARNDGVYGGGALACAQRGRGGRGGAGWCANEGGGDGEQGSGLKWPRARWGEPHARRGRGDRGTHGGGYAKTEKLTSRARGAEREKKAGAGAREAGLTGRAHGQREREAGARKAAAPTGRARCAERGGGRGARARWADWAERPRGAGKWAALPFSFILELFSPFLLFILFDSNSNEPQIQIRLFENYAPNKSEI